MQNKENVVWRVIGADTLVLLDLETGRYYSLNASAAAIWAEAARGATPADCAQALRSRYAGLGANDARAAVEDLLDDLSRRGLLTDGEPRPDGAAPTQELPAAGSFQYPTLEEHEALQEVTAGSGSGGYSYSYYYYY
jgi:hypothetical protein